MRIKSMVCGILSLVLMLSLFSGTTSANESWVTKTGMTYSTFDFGTALINGKIYAFGGSGGPEEQQKCMTLHQIHGN